MNDLRAQLLKALENQTEGLTRAQLEQALGASAATGQKILRVLRALETAGNVRYAHPRAQCEGQALQEVEAGDMPTRRSTRTGLTHPRRHPQIPTSCSPSAP